MPANKSFEELEKESLYAIMAESEKLANVGGWEWDIKKDVWTFSDNWLQIHGCSERHLKTEDLLSIAHPDDISDIQTAFDNAVTKGKHYEIEHRIIRQDNGEIRFVQAYGRPRFDSDGMTVKLFGAAQDITRRKISENKTIENQERLKALFSCIQDGIVTVGTDRLIIDCNPGFAQLFGYDMEDIPGMEMRNLYASEDKYLELGNKLREHSGDQAFIEIIECIKKNGTVFTAEVTVFFMRAVDGKITKHIGLVRDITDRLKAEKKIKESEEKFRKLVNTAPFGIQLTDLSGQIIFSNPKHHKIQGYSQNELIGKYIWDLVADDEEKKKTKRYYQNLIVEQPLPKTYYNKDLAKDGRLIDTQIDWDYIYDTDDKLVSIMSIISDITDRKQAEEELKDSEEKFRLLFDNSADAHILHKENKFVDCNAAALQMLGLTKKEELLELHPAEISPQYQKHGKPSKEQADAMIALSFEKGSHRFEWICKRADGSELTIDVLLNAIRIKNEELIHGVWRDITELKKLEKQIQHVQKMESVGTLAGGIAHEFNNILSIIIGNNELIMEDLPDWSLSKESCDEIRLAGIRARDIVKQLLTFSRQDDSSQRPIDIGTVTKDALKLIRATIPSNIKIRDRISSECAAVLADTTQIHQIFINLCSNAVDALPISGGIIDIELCNSKIVENDYSSNSTLSPGKYVKLTIKDNGCGIETKPIEKIFEPYYTTKDIGKGSGIGLAVVHGIVLNHGGSITCETVEDTGTTFIIFFPVYEGSVEEESEQKITLPGKGERVLYVDDEPLIAKLGKRHLEALGYDVFSTTDPEEALAMVKKEPEFFDLVVSDMAMPNMPGDQLIAEVLAINPNIATIICTGYSSRISEMEAEEIGVKAFLMKPINKAELAVVIRKVLDENNNRIKA